ncbi:MAG TPA: TPM domain-containing protein [Pseudoxanthomonas sp.]|nr:TPM domain-containing protein [Pseudoxanthomonas sp.]
MHGINRASVLACAIALSLVACKGEDKAAADGAKPARADREWNDEARVEAIAATLQACSYEGNPVKVDTAQLQGAAPGDCKSMVDRIMGFTGLPANFVVTAGPVDNAAAVILLDKARMPQRVIAFNPDFIDATRRATGGDTWAPVSIMAHEIGHHLSGHTITAGGSRPDIELEADKFSGYVLQKMGAPLADATKAILTFGTDVDQPTHPAKDKRAAAITQGWQEACTQSGKGNCTAGSGSSTTSDTTPTPTTRTAAVTLPTPSKASIPFKYGRFVVDETGKLDPVKLRELDAKLYDLARTKGLELTVLVVNGLHGMSAQDYAWTMMRQLRIGKLDLGNGGVIVIAPNQGESGAAFAPGVARALEFFEAGKRFDIYIKDGKWQRGCLGSSDGCSGYTDGLLGVVDSQFRSLDTEWKIRFNSIEEAIQLSKKQREDRLAGRKVDIENYPTGSLARFTGTVTDTKPKPEEFRVNERITKDGTWRAILVKTEQGQEVTLYMQPQTASLMPSGELKRGSRYTFTGELHSTGQFSTDQGVVQVNPSLWLFSYDNLD